MKSEKKIIEHFIDVRKEAERCYLNALLFSLDREDLFIKSSNKTDIVEDIVLKLRVKP